MHVAQLCSTSSLSIIRGEPRSILSQFQDWMLSCQRQAANLFLFLKILPWITTKSQVRTAKNDLNFVDLNDITVGRLNLDLGCVKETPLTGEIEWLTVGESVGEGKIVGSGQDSR